MRIPFHNPDAKEVEILRQKCEVGEFILTANPTWPCYEKDGAGKIMHVELELKFIDNNGGEFKVKEIPTEE